MGAEFSLKSQRILSKPVSVGHHMMHFRRFDVLAKMLDYINSPTVTGRLVAREPEPMGIVYWRSPDVVSRSASILGVQRYRTPSPAVRFGRASETYAPLTTRRTGRLPERKSHECSVCGSWQQRTQRNHLAAFVPSAVTRRGTIVRTAGERIITSFMMHQFLHSRQR